MIRSRFRYGIRSYLAIVSPIAYKITIKSNLKPCSLSITRKKLGLLFFSSDCHSFVNASVFRSLRMLFVTSQMSSSSIVPFKPSFKKGYNHLDETRRKNKLLYHSRCFFQHFYFFQKKKRIYSRNSLTNRLILTKSKHSKLDLVDVLYFLCSGSCCEFAIYCWANEYCALIWLR